MIIIKSLQRKTASFSQLLHYINRGRVKDDQYFFTHNIYGRKPRDIVREFAENSQYLKRRKNGNVLYHEIFSIKYQDGYTKEELRKIVLEAVEQYVKARAGNCLVYAVVHEQHNQIHMHLMISANEAGSSKPYYFSKTDFNKIIELTREYAYNKYPKLEHEEKTRKKRKARAGSKTVDNEVQFKKRTGQKSDRELMRERLQGIFSKCRTSQDFIDTLQSEKIQVYQRGKTFGFLDEATGKKYRLKTLELEREFEALNSRFMEKADEKMKEKVNTTHKGNEKSTDDKINDRQYEADRFKKEYIKPGLDKAKAETREKFYEQIKKTREARKNQNRPDFEKNKK